MSSIESHHTCFWNRCDIRGSFLHSPLLNPDKRIALDLFALLVSKSNIIHFTFYFSTIVDDGCCPRWANTDVWIAFDSEVQNLQDALILLFVAVVVIMTVMILNPKRFTECWCPHLRGITAVISSCESIFIIIIIGQIQQHLPTQRRGCVRDGTSSVLHRRVRTL